LFALLFQRKPVRPLRKCNGRRLFAEEQGADVPASTPKAHLGRNLVALKITRADRYGETELEIIEKVENSSKR
jgi:hypothetical protein